MIVVRMEVKKQAYAIRQTNGEEAEITLYGDITDDRYMSEEEKQHCITLSAFLSDLEKVAGCKKLTLRIHSYGGDAGVSVVIFNRLRDLAQAGVSLTGIVDGVAMSGGSLILCACGEILARRVSLVMIHKCVSPMFGAYNADELRKAAEENDKWDCILANAYAEKMGISKEDALSVMQETTYMTGEDAVEKGFADAILEDSEKALSIAASADGRNIYIDGRTMVLPLGMFAPDCVPTMQKRPCENKSDKCWEEREMDAEKLRTLYPDAVAEIERAAAGTKAEEGEKERMEAALRAERERMREIDQIAPMLDASAVSEAKYGEKRMTAQELAYASMLRDAERGEGYLAGMRKDAEKSNAGNVAPSAVPDEEGIPAEAQKRAAERQKIFDMLGFKGKKEGE